MYVHISDSNNIEIVKETRCMYGPRTVHGKSFALLLEPTHCPHSALLRYNNTKFEQVRHLLGAMNDNLTDAQIGRDCWPLRKSRPRVKNARGTSHACIYSFIKWRNARSFMFVNTCITLHCAVKYCSVRSWWPPVMMAPHVTEVLSDQGTHELHLSWRGVFYRCSQNKCAAGAPSHGSHNR